MVAEGINQFDVFSILPGIGICVIANVHCKQDRELGIDIETEAFNATAMPAWQEVCAEHKNE